MLLSGTMTLRRMGALRSLVCAAILLTVLFGMLLAHCMLLTLRLRLVSPVFTSMPLTTICVQDCLGAFAFLQLALELLGWHQEARECP